VSTTSTGVIVQVLALLLSGSMVPLLMFLFRRRPELRKLGTESDVNSSTAAVNYSKATETLLANLVADGERYRTLTEKLQTNVERLQAEAVQSQRDCSRQLDVAHGENQRLATRVAQLNTDLDIAHRQISDMASRFPHDPMTREV
jgi:multidrug resistance efflux pump